MPTNRCRQQPDPRDELIRKLAAADWYPLRAGDVVAVDAGQHGGQTYQALGADPRTTTGFDCPRCRRVSQHPIDIAAGYCGACHDWTGDEPLLRIISESGGLPFRVPNDPSREVPVSFAALWFDEWDATISVLRGGQVIFVRNPAPDPIPQLTGGGQQ